MAPWGKQEEILCKSLLKICFNTNFVSNFNPRICVKEKNYFCSKLITIHVKSNTKFSLIISKCLTYHLNVKLTHMNKVLVKQNFRSKIA